MNAAVKYREVSPGLRREFSLYPGKVVIIGRVVGGKDFETHIPLKELMPDFGYVRFRSRRCAAGFLLFTALAVFLWVFLGPFRMPLLSARVGVTAALAGMSLGLALAYLPKYKAYRIVNNQGVVIIDVIEAGPDKARCREFVEQIAAAIREAAKTV